MTRKRYYIGMDVHKDTVQMAVFGKPGRNRSTRGVRVPVTSTICGTAPGISALSFALSNKA